MTGRVVVGLSTHSTSVRSNRWSEWNGSSGCSTVLEGLLHPPISGTVV